MPAHREGTTIRLGPWMTASMKARAYFEQHGPKTFAAGEVPFLAGVRVVPRGDEELVILATVMPPPKTDADVPAKFPHEFDGLAVVFETEEFLAEAGQAEFLGAMILAHPGK